jgi:hypothetical protein
MPGFCSTVSKTINKASHLPGEHVTQHHEVLFHYRRSQFNPMGTRIEPKAVQNWLRRPYTFRASNSVAVPQRLSLH